MDGGEAAQLTHNEREGTQRGWATLGLWAIGTLLGWHWAIIGVMLVYSHTGIGSDGLEVIVGLPLSLSQSLIGAIFLATGQAWAFGRRFPGAVAWGLTTAGGMLAGAAVIGIIGFPVMLSAVLAPDFRVAWLTGAGILGALFGGSLGLCQWRVLRHVVAGAYWWILISLVAWSVGTVVCWGAFIGLANPPALPNAFMSPLDASESLPSVVSLISGGLVIGLATGGFLRLLVRISGPIGR